MLNNDPHFNPDPNYELECSLQKARERGKTMLEERCRSGWQDANHAWQDWLDNNLPNWTYGVDLTTMPNYKYKKA